MARDYLREFDRIELAGERVLWIGIILIKHEGQVAKQVLKQAFEIFTQENGLYC
jgi:hypothetical protein